MLPVVVTGRHPHEAGFLIFSALLGAAFVFGAKPPGPLEQLMPGWVLWVWYVLLLTSGVVGIISFTLRDPYRVLVLEGAAMWGQAAAPALYGLALFSLGRPEALFAGGFAMTWSAISIWRLVQVRRGLHALRSVGEETT